MCTRIGRNDKLSKLCKVVSAKSSVVPKVSSNKGDIRLFNVPTMNFSSHGCFSLVPFPFFKFRTYPIRLCKIQIKVDYMWV